MTRQLRPAVRRRPAGRGDEPAADPFVLLGLEAGPDLTDDDVRAAWRRIAAATHPDRADGGDAARFAAAASAYTALRTRFGRTEALAEPGTAATAGPSGPAGPAAAARLASPARSPRRSPWAGPAAARAAGHLTSRVRRGRPGRLALRVLAAGCASAGAVVIAGDQPATPALITGAVTWLALTARRDLAPPGPDS